MPASRSRPAREIAAQNLAGGEGGVAVAENAIQRTPAQGAAEVLGEPGGLAPAESAERKDVREAVAEEEDVSLFARPPRRVAGQDFVDRYLFRSVKILRRGQLQHPRDVAEAADLFFGELQWRALWGDGGRNKRGEIFRDEFHRFRPPVRIGLQVKRDAIFAEHQGRNGVENAHTRIFQARLEFSERRIVQRCAPVGVGGKSIRLEARLHRYGHRNQINPARRELIPKIDDRLDRIRLHLVDARSVSQLRRIEKRRTGDVIDVGPVKEPRIAAEIDLFVARSEFSGEHGLNAWQQPGGNNRLAFELFLRGLELRGAREEVPQIPARFAPPGLWPRQAAPCRYSKVARPPEGRGEPNSTANWIDGNRHDGEKKEGDEQHRAPLGRRRCA